MMNNIFNVVLIIIGIYIICATIAFYKLAKKSIEIKYQKNKIESDRLIKDTTIDNSAIESLDTLIQDILEEYVILQMKPKVRDIYYINNNMETEMREYIVEEVSNRIPVLLMKKLEYICNPDYLGDLIGKRVYMAVMNYVLEFNTNGNNVTSSTKNK